MSLWRKVEWRLLQIKGRFVFGRSARIHGNFRVENIANVRIGKNVSINSRVFILGASGVTIGDNVTLSAGSMLIDTGLVVNKNEPQAHRPHQGSPIVLEDEVWIGAGAIVLAGVTVGRGSVVGAGAVVTKNVPPRTVVAGVPAREIRKVE